MVTYFKMGGFSKEDLCYVEYAGVTIPEEGNAYIFTSLAMTDGSLGGGGWWLSITALEDGIDAKDYEKSQAYKEMVKLCDNEIETKASKSLPHYRAMDDPAFGDGSYNKKQAKKDAEYVAELESKLEAEEFERLAAEKAK